MQKMFVFVVTSIALLFASTIFADSLYITDKISIPVYSQKDKSSEILKRLPSGTIVEVLSKNSKFSQVRTNDDIDGWVESKFLTNEKPTQIEYLQLVAKYKAAQHKIQDYQTRLLDMQELRKEAKTADWLRNQLNKNERSESALEQKIKLKDIEIADLKITIANLEEKLIQSRSQLDEVVGSIQSGNSQHLLTAIEDDGSESLYSTSSASSFYTWLILSLAVTLIIGILMGFVLIDYKVRKKHGDLKFY